MESNNNNNQFFSCAFCGANITILDNEENFAFHCFACFGGEKSFDELNDEGELSKELISISKNIQTNHTPHEELNEANDLYYSNSESFSFNFLSHKDLNNNQIVNEIINNLKIKVIKEDLHKFSDNKCIICQENYKIGDNYIELPCKHFFHDNCIKSWIKTKTICPICKLQLDGNNLNIKNEDI